MKLLLIILFIFPTFSWGQDSTKSKYFKIRPYGEIAAILNKAQYFGGGGIIGLQLSKNFGIGGGIETYQIDNIITEMATPAFLDVRFFFNSNKNIFPFLAFNIGNYTWNYKTNTRLGSNEYINSETNGKEFFGGEVGFWLSKKRKRNGLMFSFAFKQARFNTIIESQYYQSSGNQSGQYIKKTNSTDSNDPYGALKFGFKF